MTAGSNSNASTATRVKRTQLAMEGVASQGPTKLARTAGSPAVTNAPALQNSIDDLRKWRIKKSLEDQERERLDAEAAAKAFDVKLQAMLEMEPRINRNTDLWSLHVKLNACVLVYKFFSRRTGVHEVQAVKFLKRMFQRAEEVLSMPQPAATLYANVDNLLMLTAPTQVGKTVISFMCVELGLRRHAVNRVILVTVGNSLRNQFRQRLVDWQVAGERVLVCAHTQQQLTRAIEHAARGQALGERLIVVLDEADALVTDNYNQRKNAEYERLIRELMGHEPLPSERQVAGVSVIQPALILLVTATPLCMWSLPDGEVWDESDENSCEEDEEGEEGGWDETENERGEEEGVQDEEENVGGEEDGRGEDGGEGEDELDAGETAGEWEEEREEPEVIHLMPDDKDNRGGKEQEEPTEVAVIDTDDEETYKEEEEEEEEDEEQKQEEEEAAVGNEQEGDPREARGLKSQGHPSSQNAPKAESYMTHQIRRVKGHSFFCVPPEPGYKGILDLEPLADPKDGQPMFLSPDDMFFQDFADSNARIISRKFRLLLDDAAQLAKEQCQGPVEVLLCIGNKVKYKYNGIEKMALRTRTYMQSKGLHCTALVLHARGSTVYPVNCPTKWFLKGEKPTFPDIPQVLIVLATPFIFSRGLSLIYNFQEGIVAKPNFMALKMGPAFGVEHVYHASGRPTGNLDRPVKVLMLEADFHAVRSYTKWLQAITHCLEESPDMTIAEAVITAKRKHPDLASDLAMRWQHAREQWAGGHYTRPFGKGNLGHHKLAANTKGHAPPTGAQPEVSSRAKAIRSCRSEAPASLHYGSQPVSHMLGLSSHARWSLANLEAAVQTVQQLQQQHLEDLLGPVRGSLPIKLLTSVKLYSGSELTRWYNTNRKPFGHTFQLDLNDPAAVVIEVAKWRGKNRLPGMLDVALGARDPDSMVLYRGRKQMELELMERLPAAGVRYYRPICFTSKKQGPSVRYLIVDVLAGAEVMEGNAAMALSFVPRLDESIPEQRLCDIKLIQVPRVSAMVYFAQGPVGHTRTPAGMAAVRSYNAQHAMAPKRTVPAAMAAGQSYNAQAPMGPEIVVPTVLVADISPSSHESQNSSGTYGAQILAAHGLTKRTPDRPLGRRCQEALRALYCLYQQEVIRADIRILKQAGFDSRQDHHSALAFRLCKQYMFVERVAHQTYRLTDAGLQCCQSLFAELDLESGGSLGSIDQGTNYGVLKASKRGTDAPAHHKLLVCLAG